MKYQKINWSISKPNSYCTAHKRRSYRFLRIDAGGDLSTDRPSQSPVLVQMRNGAISLLASFTSRCRFTWSQANAPRSIARTLVRVLAGTLHYFAAVQAQLDERVDWSVARHYNEAVLTLPLEHNALPGRRQEPPHGGFCRL